jgi:uncharacterized protein YggT (Ycf19 family)
LTLPPAPRSLNPPPRTDRTTAGVRGRACKLAGARARVSPARAAASAVLPGAPRESLAVAAVVAGKHASLALVAGTASSPAETAPASRLRAFFRAQAAEGAAMVGRMDLGASALFLVSAAMSYKEQKMVALVTQAVGSFIKLYLLLLFVRVLLTWFPNVDWMRQPWSILRQITDPYLNLFRNLIPPIMGQIDFTPILGFMVLQFLAKVLSSDPSVGRF